MKNTLFAFLVLFTTVFLSGCVKDHTEPLLPISGDDKLRLTLRVGDPEDVSTRSEASTPERSIDAVTVLVFSSSSTGTFKSGEYITASSGQIEGENGAISRKLTTALMPVAGDYIIVLANPVITTIPLIAGESKVADINKHFAMPTTENLDRGGVNLPMSGSIASYNPAKSQECLLVRSAAKIQLLLDSGLPEKDVTGDFTADKVQWGIYNGLSSQQGGAFFAPSDATACVIRDGVSGAMFIDLPINKKVVGGSASASEVNTYLPEYPSAKWAKAVTVAENSWSSNRICMVLEVGSLYYRLDLYDHVAKKYIDIRRNTHITVKINQVKSAGYTSLAEALAAPGGNLEYDIRVDGANDGIVASNGSYALSLSNDRLTIYTDEKEFDLEVCTARYILPAEFSSLPAGITNKVVFRYPERDNSEFTILTSTINKADTPVKIHVKRKSIESSSYTYLNVCLGSIVYRVPVDVIPALRSGSRISLAENTVTYRWIKMAEGVTLNETEGIVSVGADVLRWVRYDTYGNEIASSEADFEAVPLFAARSAELEGYGDGSITKYRIDVTAPELLYAGWFGGDPIGGTGDTGGPRFSKRLLVDTQTTQTTQTAWGPPGLVGGIALDKEQGEAITKLLGAKGSSYAAADYCYMKNDTNKNGRIDADEPIVWYLPAQNQLMALWVVMQGLNTSWSDKTYWSVSESGSTYGWIVRFDDGNTSDNVKSNNSLVRCVRNF